MRAALGLVLVLGFSGCIPLLAPHGEARGHIGVAAGRTRAGAEQGARLTGHIDAVYLPTVLLGCERDFDLALGARFHFVEPERPEVRPHRIGGVLSGSWIFFREPFARGELRLDLDAVALDDRAVAGASLAVGIEVIGFAEGAGAWASWEGLFAGAWSGEAGLRLEAMIGYHEDFGSVRYATFTVGLSGRWPAGAGVGVVNPILLAMLAADAGRPSSGAPASVPSSSAPSSSAPSASPGSSSPGSSGGSSSEDIHGCPDVPAVPGATPAWSPPPELVGAPRYDCLAVDGTRERVEAYELSGAVRACEMMLAIPCTCVLSE